MRNEGGDKTTHEKRAREKKPQQRKKREQKREGGRKPRDASLAGKSSQRKPDGSVSKSRRGTRTPVEDHM